MDTYSRIKKLEIMKDVLSKKNDINGLMGLENIFKHKSREYIEDYNIKANVKLYSNCKYIDEINLEGKDINIKSIVIESKNIIDDNKEPTSIEFIGSSWNKDVYTVNFKVNVDFIKTNEELPDEGE